MIRQPLRASSTVLVVIAGLLAGCGGQEQRLANYMERGERFLDDRNFDKARVELSNALQIEPENAQARYLLGRIAERQAKPREAVGNYQAAIDIDAEFVPARAALARLYLMGGLADKAREIVEPALRLAPDDAESLVVRGGLRARDGDSLGALEDAEAAVRAAPDSELAIAFLAAQYRQHDRRQDAVKLVEAGVAKRPDRPDLRIILAELLYGEGRYDEAEAQLRAIAEQQPGELAAWHRLAQFHLQRKDVAAAEVAYQSAVDANPDNVDAKNALISFIASHGGADRARQQILEFVAAEPENAELKLALGQFLEANGEPEKAAAEYRSIIAAEGVKGHGLEARNRLAAMLVRGADLAGAEKLIAEVLEKNPRDSDALVLRGGIALSRNQTSAAITDLRSVLRDQPDSIPIMRTLARAHIQDDDFALAEEVFRAALQVNPTDPQLRLDLAELLTRTERPALARPLLEQLVRDLPENLTVREALVRVLLTAGEPQAAMAAADVAKRLRPELPVGYMLVGFVHEHSGRLPEATSEYERAERVSDDPTLALTALVRVDLARKQPRQALDRLAARMDEDPKDARALNLQGEVLTGQARFPEAQQIYSKAVELQPQWWVPWRGLARAQLGAGQNEQALSTLKDGLSRTDGAVQLAGDLATLQELLQRFDDAILTYEGILKRTPENMAAANNLAMLLVTHRADEASLERATSLADRLAGRKDAPFLDTRGWVKYRRGQYTEALPLLREAAEKAPKSPEILYHLGMAQYRSGEQAAAKSSLQHALQSGRSFRGAEEARATLLKLESNG